MANLMQEVVYNFYVTLSEIINQKDILPSVRMSVWKKFKNIDCSV